MTALQHEAELLSIELELCKQITKYLIRIQMLSMKHPMKNMAIESDQILDHNK